jgi:CDGSH-type Zn-finger protein
MPLMFAMILQYCNFRIWRTSKEDEQKKRKGFKVLLDERGVWKQLGENDQIIDIEQRYGLNPCCKCGNIDLRVERYFDLIGFVSPRMQFMVHCKCGHSVHKKYMAMSAVREWNKKNKKGVASGRLG